MKIKLISVVFLLLVFFLFPMVGMAADGNYGDVNLAPANNTSGGLVPCGNGTNDPCTLCHFIIGFQNLVNFMLKLVITMAFVGIFAAGVMYIISSGDDGMMTNAKKALTASLVGFSIVMGAWLIVNVTIWALGAKIDVATGKKWYEFSCLAKSSNTTVPASAPAQMPCSQAGGMCSALGGNDCLGSSTVIKNGVCAGGAVCCTKITP